MSVTIAHPFMACYNVTAMVKALSITLTAFCLCSCDSVERYINWFEYKEAALKDNMVPLKPEELYPENPEKAYVSEWNRLYLAGIPIKEERRAKLVQAMQQATQIQVLQIRAADAGHYCKETTERTHPPVQVNGELRTLLQRWASAPLWLSLSFCDFDVAGWFCYRDEFIFLDAEGNELDRLSIGHLDDICKPEGQDYYDHMKETLNKLLNVPQTP